jgi:hypothetical protein
MLLSLLSALQRHGGINEGDRADWKRGEDEHIIPHIEYVSSAFSLGLISSGLMSAGRARVIPRIASMELRRLVALLDLRAIRTEEHICTAQSTETNTAHPAYSLPSGLPNLFNKHDRAPMFDEGQHDPQECEPCVEVTFEHIPKTRTASGWEGAK